MTMQAEELLGVQVAGTDGKVIGTVEQIFGDDDGAPAWARIRSGRTSRFVPLGSGQVTRDGLSIPYDAQKIMTGPKIEVGEHMSGAQAAELNEYFDGSAGDQSQSSGQQRSGKSDQRGSSGSSRGEQGGGQQSGGNGSGGEWVVRREQQLKVGKETMEAGHVKLHRYVDEEPAEQTVTVFHEEYDVERAPVSSGQKVGDNLSETEKEITLHEERGFATKETVPVEQVRLVPKRVQEEQTFSDDIQRERIEVEADAAASGSGSSRTRSRA